MSPKATYRSTKISLPNFIPPVKSPKSAAGWQDALHCGDSFALKTCLIVTTDKRKHTNDGPWKKILRLFPFFWPRVFTQT